jgi:hypothetical protein
VEEDLTLGNQAFEQASLLQAYRHTFLTAPGRVVLADLASHGRMDSNTFDRDPYVAAFNAGMREMALHIFQQLNVDIEQYLLSNVTEDYHV